MCKKVKILQRHFATKLIQQNDYTSDLWEYFSATDLQQGLQTPLWCLEKTSLNITLLQGGEDS